MKKQTFAVKCMRAVTKNPIYFYGILSIGVALFLYLTLNTHIDTAEGSMSLFRMIFAKAGRGL